MIPAGTFLFGFKADLLGRVRLQEVDYQVAEDGAILGRVARADPALIFAEAHIERPRQRVFDRPVAAHGACEGDRVGPRLVI